MLLTYVDENVSCFILALIRSHVTQTKIVNSLSKVAGIVVLHLCKLKNQWILMVTLQCISANGILNFYRFYSTLQDTNRVKVFDTDYIFTKK